MMKTPPGTHVVYVIRWEEQDFSDTVTYEMVGQLFEAPYEYILRVPKISDSYSVDCPTPTPTPIPPSSPTPTSVPPTPTRQPPSPTSALGVGSTLVREKDGMEMVYVPGGTFEMGSTDAEIDAAFEQCEQDRGGSEYCAHDYYESETPRHSVTLDAFWIDRTEVTNAQYARCVADGTCSPPSKSGSWTRDSYYDVSQFDDYPVIYVSWDDADTYCQWAGGRLPTEAEWEYAARGPDGHIYPWGNETPDDTWMNYNVRGGDTTKVGSYPDGASWVGAMDMAGNVCEWVYDWYASDYYRVSPVENPTGPDTGDYRRVLRGGMWGDDRTNLRSAARSGSDPSYRYDNLGFRCVVASTSSP